MTAANTTGEDLLNFLIAPESMVVVGVSPSPQNLAKEILCNSLAFGYKGELFAVGPKGGEVFGKKIHRSLAELPMRPKFAVILVPAIHVPSLIEECGRLGIKGALISSGGFSEYESTRGDLEAGLIAAARRYGVRFLGPNCIGVVNLEIGLCMPFAPIRSANPLKGHVSVISQSGGVGLRCMDLLTEEHLGFSKMISVGNKLDVDESDCIEALSADPDTRVICIYLEGISRGRRFVEVSSRSPKPIIALKANRSPISNIIAQSHTAALASDDRIVAKAFEQAGIVRVNDLREFVPSAKAFELPPLKGNRLAVVSMSGGLSVMGADACAEFGFELPPLPESLTRELERRRRGGVIHLGNPLDFGDIYDPSAFAFAINELLKLPYIDGAVVSLPRLDGLSHSGGEESDFSDKTSSYFKELMVRMKKPVAISFFSGRRAIEPLLASRRIPLFLDIRESIWALSLQRDYWKRKQAEGKGTFSVPRREAAAGQAKVEEEQLPADAALDMLHAAGIAVPKARVVTTIEEAEEAAQLIGFPLAIKAAVSEIVHKTDLGALRLDLRSLEDVRESFKQLEELCCRRGLPARVLLQAMAKPGIELIVGGRRDSTFGPIVLFGLGGIWVEVLEDVAVRLAPVEAEEAREMIEEIKGSRLLHGFRGREKVQVESVCAAIVAVSRLMATQPEISEVEVNPLIASAAGAVAVDARVRRAPPVAQAAN